MNMFLLGAGGAILVLLLFIGGAFMGWKARGAYARHLESLRPAPRDVHQPSEEELRQFMEDQEAFSTMLHYSPEIAYGIASDPLQEAAKKET